MAADESRVAPGPAATRGRPVTLRLNGRAVPAYEGDTVGAALHAAGERALMRSIKYHRPRGLFCCTGKCASCLMRVDGVPNVRACVTPVRDGMKVETQNAFPNARRDVFSIVDKVFPENFDYHARFIRPRVLAPLFNDVVRRMAGFGKVPDLRPVRAPRRPPIRRVSVDVAVIGAGPSGLAAAIAAAEAGATVACFDEGDRAGGSLLLERDVDGRHGAHVADEMAARLAAAGGALHASSVAFGLYQTDGVGDRLAPPGLLAVMTPTGIVEVSAKTVVAATGYHETPPLFAGNDLPGVMGARAALILLERHGVLAGRRVAVASAHPRARRAAQALQESGAQVVGMVGEGEWKDATVAEAFGGDRVEGIVLARGGTTWRERVDLVIASGDETPRIELVQQAGGKLRGEGWALVPWLEGARTSVDALFAAGSVADPDAPVRERLASGARAGEAAARHARPTRAGVGA